MMRSIWRARSFGISAFTFGIFSRDERCKMQDELRQVSCSSFIFHLSSLLLSHRPQHVELHQFLERDRRVEIFAGQTKGLVESLEDHFHPEGQLLITARLRILSCDV